MTFSISSPDEVDEHEQTWPVVLPNGETAYCPVDAAGRIDPRAAYGPWLRTYTPPPRTRPERNRQR